MFIYTRRGALFKNINKAGGAAMSVSKILMIITAFFFVLGAVDRLAGNKLGFGAEFERGFGLMAPTALTVLGLMCLAPVLAKGLLKVIGPLFDLIGADPAMLPGVMLSCDVGYPVASEIAGNALLGRFGGLVVGSVMGFVVSFSIPVACGLVEKEQYRYLAAGILAGYIFDPAACFVGGVAMGIPAMTVLRNLVPVIIVACVIILGLVFAPEGTIKVFKWFAKLIMAVITVGLSAAAVEAMTGFVVIKGMNPISNGFKVVGTIVLSLGGTLPMLYFLRRVLRRPLTALGSAIGINEDTVLSILVGLSSLIPGYSSYGKMNPKGRVIFAAFSASGACMLGSHMGFTSAIDQSVVMPMLLSKCIAAVLGIAAACIVFKRMGLDDSEV